VGVRERAENSRSGREEEEWGGGARMGGPLAGWIHLTLRTLPPKVLEVRLCRIPPGVPAVGYEGYLHCFWRYRHVSINFSLFRLPLTRRATSIDCGGILCNPTSTVSGGSKKGLDPA
jgi:hypothetical protein